MSRLPISTKERALSLRKRGYSIKEIATKLHAAKSTISLWTRDIQLGQAALTRLHERKALGACKTTERWKTKREIANKLHFAKAKATIGAISSNRDQLRLYCALLYWGEGGKGANEAVLFTNSDPSLIQSFLYLLRHGFEIDESKLRVLMHLHSYHDEEKQREFWINITSIPKSQFQRTFHKQNTKKRIKDGYPGCVRIAYYDINIAREIRALYKIFANEYGGVR